MNEVKQRRRASAHWNGDFYLIETYSGHGRSGRDPNGKQHDLPPLAMPQELGAALLDALAHSRFLSLDQIGDFFNYDKREKAYKAWVQSLIERHGYKTKRALFKNMACCSIDVILDEGQMRIRPMRHDTLEGWVGAQNEGVEDVFLPADSAPEAVGEALLLAFSRCT